jgi:superfamily II DNA/RNA helicase
MSSFADFGLLPTILKTLRDLKISRPTEIQTQVIPLLMSNQTTVGVSETGSGKTLAYALPMLQLIKTIESEGEVVEVPARPRAVVMVPTRELGEQVAKVFKLFTHDTRLRVRSALGGAAFDQVRRNISSPFEILLATPGRIVQLLDKELLDLTDVRMLVFDEADQMMDQGFLPDSNYVVNACPQNVNLSLFSATVSKAVQDLINEQFKNAEFVKSSKSGKTVTTLMTENLIVQDGQRWSLFEKLLRVQVEGGTLVFTNTREQCDKLASEVLGRGFECVIYRGDMDKNERKANLKNFREGHVKVLVATDLAGRGLDIPSVGRVINFHLPKEMENYLHRAGRTARAGRKGLVINLVTERDSRLIAQLKGDGPPSLDKKVQHKTKTREVGRNGERYPLNKNLKRPKKKN